MRFLLYLFAISISLVSAVSIVHAQSSYDINIPTGAASPDAPFFWQSEKDGQTNGVIEILTSDEVVWKNADTAAHTITSGTPEIGPDGLFDSGLLAPGQKFPETFTTKGNYPYYCILHPWMTGTVIVTEGFSIVPNVGKNVGDGLTTFDVEYKLNRLLSLSSIDENKKSITFEIIGNAKSDNNNLTLRLPAELIDGPFVVWVDGQQISNFEHEKDENLNTLHLELAKNSKELTIVGTSVVPEFGVVTMAVLTMGIICIVLVTRRFELKNYI